MPIFYILDVGHGNCSVLIDAAIVTIIDAGKESKLIVFLGSKKIKEVEDTEDPRKGGGQCGDKVGFEGGAPVLFVDDELKTHLHHDVGEHNIGEQNQGMPILGQVEQLGDHHPQNQASTKYVDE